MVYVDEYDLLAYLGTPPGSDCSDAESDGEWETVTYTGDEYYQLVKLWHELCDMAPASGLFTRLTLRGLVALAHATSSCFMEDPMALELHRLCLSHPEPATPLDPACTLFIRRIDLLYPTFSSNVQATRLFDCLSLPVFRDFACRFSDPGKRVDDAVAEGA